MRYRLLVLTTDPTVMKWESLNDKKKSIIKALDQTQNGDWEISIQYRAMTPQVDTTGRITQNWYDTISHPLFNAGHQFIYLHFSMKQWGAFGLDRSIRGANQRDEDFVGESYGRGDEHTRRGKTKENQFVQNILHEVSHEIARTTNVTDNTHKYHDKNPDISGIFASYDMAKWQPVYRKQMGIIANLRAIIASLLASKRV